jgi:hypothetical protein
MELVGGMTPGSGECSGWRKPGAVFIELGYLLNGRRTPFIEKF